jgi:hypothetical protein
MVVSTGSERDRLKKVGEAIDGVLGESEMRASGCGERAAGMVHHLQILKLETKSRNWNLETEN